MTSTSERSRPDADLLERLRRIDTASLSDADKALHVLPPTIRPLVSGVRMAGRAVTAVANGDLMSVIGALEIGGIGDVLVISAGGFDQAVSGELFGTEAFRRGMSGVVIDGLSRDSAEAIVDAAEAIQTREKTLRISIENGFSLFDTLNFTEHRERLIAGVDSKLTFEG